MLHSDKIEDIGFHLENGKIPTLMMGFGDDIRDMISFIPFYFLVDRYDGWKMNIIGNITMFIPKEEIS